MPQPPLPLWVSYVQAFGVPSVLAVIAAFGAWIGACQMWIARERLRLDAFDRVYNRRAVAIYEATRKFLGDVFNDMSEEKIRAYGLCTLDAEFLFDENMYNYLREVLSYVTEWHHAKTKGNAETSEETKQAYKAIAREKLDWITLQGDKRFPARFSMFLVYRPAKHPWYLRWLPTLDIIPPQNTVFYNPLLARLP